MVLPRSVWGIWWLSTVGTGITNDSTIYFSGYNLLSKGIWETIWSLLDSDTQLGMGEWSGAAGEEELELDPQGNESHFGTLKCGLVCSSHHQKKELWQQSEGMMEEMIINTRV